MSICCWGPGALIGAWNMVDFNECVLNQFLPKEPMGHPIDTSIVYGEMSIKSVQVSPTSMEVRLGGGDWVFSKCAN